MNEIEKIYKSLVFPIHMQIENNFQEDYIDLWPRKLNEWWKCPIFDNPQPKGHTTYYKKIICGCTFFNFFCLIMKFLNCYHAIEGQVCETNEDDLIETISNVETIEQCRNLCHSNPNCVFFNYFGSNSFPFDKLCMILSSCNSLFECEDCFAEDSFCYR